VRGFVSSRLACPSVPQPKELSGEECHWPRNSTHAPAEHVLCVSDSRVCSTVGPPTSCSGVMRVFLCEGQSMLEGTDADPSSSLTLCCCGE